MEFVEVSLLSRCLLEGFDSLLTFFYFKPIINLRWLNLGLFLRP